MKAIQTVAFDARYVNDQFHGIGRHAYNSLNALIRLDSKRHYLVYYHPDYRNTRFNMEVLRERANVELRPIRLPLYIPSEQFVWPVLLAKARVDLFHSPYVVLPLLSRIKSIMTIYDLILEHHPEYMPRSYMQSFYRPIVQLGVQRASLVLTLSESIRSDIQKYYRVNHARIRVTSSGVDATFQKQSDPIHLAAVRKRYGLPEHFILALGAGRPHKNIETLVEAFAHLDPSLAPMLVIAGEPDPRFPDGVNARIHTYDIMHRVIRPGRIRESDLPTIYSLADIFVFPSFIEGFGLPPLEAMACGTPVLTSRIPAVSDVVGDAALTFDAHDASQLAAILSRVLTDASLRNTLIHHGLERVRAFTWERVARETLKAYSSIEGVTGEVLHAPIH